MYGAVSMPWVGLCRWQNSCLKTDMEANFKVGVFQMKNLRKVSGFIFVAAIIAWTLLACEPFPASNQTPVAGDYDIGNLTQSVASISAVTITPKSGKSSGARTIYYAGGISLPTAAGTYPVTFDVAAVTGWNAAAGLSAGTLEINDLSTPIKEDYDIDNLAQAAGSVTAVTITPKSGKSSGTIKIYYEGTSGTSYLKSATLPTAAGTYAVTFDVAAASGWNPATGLSAGNLVIGATQTQTIEATIMGTPGVVKQLTADVKKNFSGALTYQWYANGTAIENETYMEFYPRPSHAGKQITVKVTCGGATGKSATSPAVTIPSSFTWTAVIDQYGTYLYASASIEGENNNPWTFSIGDEGFSGEWFRDNVKFTPSSDPNLQYRYQIDPTVDGGHTISVKITGYGATKTSNGIPVQNTSAPPVVAPNVNIDYNNGSSRSGDEVHLIAYDIQRAYEQNINNCHTAIHSLENVTSWCIDFVDAASNRNSKILGGELHIYFSCDWYDNLSSNDATKLEQIGNELALRAMGAEFISFGKEYSGNYEDLRMAKAGVT